MLTADDIFAVPDVMREKVMVPEWGRPDQPVEERFVYVQGLAGDEKDAFDQSLIERRGRKTRLNMANARAKFVALVAVDAGGKRIFTDAQVTALGRRSALPLDRIYTVGMRLSGSTEEDMEELLGNSQGIPAGASTSDSPSASAAV